MKNTIIKSMLSDPANDEYSYKRVIGVVGSFALIFDMLCCSFFRWAVPPPEFLATVVEYIVIGCLFGTVGEKITEMIANRGQTVVKKEITSTVKETASSSETEIK